jgi:hypothetical protein
MVQTAYELLAALRTPGVVAVQVVGMRSNCLLNTQP